MNRSNLVIVWLVVILFCISTASCKPTPAVETALPSQEQPVVQENVGASTAIAETPAPISSKVGGTFVIAVSNEPDTLDCQKSAQGSTNEICQFFGGALVAMDPQNGEIISYHAQSWSVAGDGLTYTFSLKPGILFHDGTPLLASDYAYSLTRLIDPETAAPTAGAMEGVTEIVAIDDLTVEIRLSTPNAFLLQFLSSPGYTMPYSEMYMTQNGDDYFAQHPMGVGPYVFEEYVTGSKVTLKRNPQFSWGPAYGDGSAYNFEAIEVLIIPEESTILAGMETGEIHYTPVVSANIAPQYAALEQVILQETPSYEVSGMFMNVNHPALKDLRVRQAINYGIDRTSIVELIFKGKGIPLYSALSPITTGYNADLETTGYKYDPDKAMAMLVEAGYTLGADGIFEKEGERLSLKVNTEGRAESKIKLAEVLQQQLKSIGIEITIQQMDEGISVESWATGQFELQLLGYQWENAGVLPLIFHTAAFGGGIWGGFDNTGLDEMLIGVQTISDQDAWMENVLAVQQKIMADALFVPIYTPFDFNALSRMVQDAIPVFSGGFQFDEAWLAVE